MRTASVLLTWVLLACIGAFAWSQLGSRLSGSIEIPGSQSQTASDLLKEHFDYSYEGSFTVLFDAPASKWGSDTFVKSIESSVDRAARAAEGRASPLRSLNPRESYAELSTALSVEAARERTHAIQKAIGHHPETRTAVTGFSIVSDELTSIVAEDLRSAEIIALPVTALILLVFFGSFTAAAVPLVFGLVTISIAMGVIWIETWFVSIPIYATNVVTLVGIALAIDYSMLYVARYREEAHLGLGPEPALRATARTAGRALAISGAVVAAGLVPLAFISIPFFSGLGLATVVVPVVSLLAALTFLPALLRALAPRLEQKPLRPRWRGNGRETGDRLVGLVMRRAGLIALASAALMLVVALPVSGLALTGGSAEFTRRAQLQRPAGGERRAEQPLASYEVLIDSGLAGGSRLPGQRTAERRLLRNLAGNSAVNAIQAPAAASSWAQAKQLGLVDPSARFARIRVIGAQRSGSHEAEAFVQLLRTDYLPRAGLPASRTWVGGPSASDYDLVHTVEENVSSLALAIVAIMYVLLAALLRSPLLPLKAIAMSALSVAAACGVLVLVFQLGWTGLAGSAQGEGIEAWVPVLLFAALFGISTDYEIFMVTRMREEWLRAHDNERAVRTGLRLVGGMITASALVMLTIFAGFTVSRVTALQQFGIGLVAGVLIDATVVRLLLVPALMKLMGRWNWSFRPPRPVAALGRAAGSSDGR